MRNPNRQPAVHPPPPGPRYPPLYKSAQGIPWRSGPPNPRLPRRYTLGYIQPRPRHSGTVPARPLATAAPLCHLPAANFPPRAGAAEVSRGHGVREGGGGGAAGPGAGRRAGDAGGGGRGPGAAGLRVRLLLLPPRRLPPARLRCARPPPAPRACLSALAAARRLVSSQHCQARAGCPGVSSGESGLKSGGAVVSEF